MGTTVGLLMGGHAQRCEFPLVSDSQVEDVAEEVMDVFREFALPYVEQWSSLQAIDVELNEVPGIRTIHRAAGWFRCSTGIIVAKLVGRPNYRQLAAFHHDVMARIDNGFYLKRFEALLKSLDEIAAGSGHSP